MEKILLNDMEPGKTYDTLILVTDVVQRDAKNNKPYCVFSLVDGKASVNANRFSDSTPATLENNRIYAGKVCEVSLEVSVYAGAPSFIIKSIRPAEAGTYDIGDFIVKAPVDPQKMYDTIMNVLCGCSLSVKQVALNLYTEHKEKLLYWSAAKAFHHNYYAGLLYHTYRMLSHSAVVCKIYKNLNRDLLLVGTALHDIGKLKEFETDPMGNAAYTVDGNLFGHLLMGVEMIDAEVAKNPSAYNPEEVRLLKHMVASHHGNLDMGAVRVPATMEAVALYFIDMMDARMEICDSNYQNMMPGEVTDRNVLGLDSRLYRGML